MSFPERAQAGQDPVRVAARLRRAYRIWRHQAKVAREPFYALPTAFGALLNDDRLRPEAVGLLIYCMLHANDAGEVKESMAAIARHFGVNTSTISRRFDKLEQANLVKILQLRDGQSCRAFLIPYTLEKVPTP